jgi:gas vesicle protein
MNNETIIYYKILQELQEIKELIKQQMIEYKKQIEIMSIKNNETMIRILYHCISELKKIFISEQEKTRDLISNMSSQIKDKIEYNSNDIQKVIHKINNNNLHQETNKVNLENLLLKLKF